MISAVFTYNFRMLAVAVIPVVAYFATLWFCFTHISRMVLYKYLTDYFDADRYCFLFTSLFPTGVYFLVKYVMETYYGDDVVAFLLRGAAYPLRKAKSYVKRQPVSGHSNPDVPFATIRPPSHPTVDALLEQHHLQGPDEYQTLQTPHFQVTLKLRRLDGSEGVIGHAVRMHNHLITLHHLLDIAPLDMIYLEASRPGKGTASVCANEYKWETLVGDVAYASLEGKVMPYTTNAQVRPLTSKRIAIMSTGYSNANSSMGLLDNCKDGWGMVQYQGAARSGFCGAAYYSGKILYGIHTVGGATRLGYSAQYLSLFIAKLQSSDYEMLMAAITRSHDRRYRIGSRNLDETQVYHQGTYYLVENSELDELIAQFPVEEYNYDHLEAEFEPRTTRRNLRRHAEREEEITAEWELQGPDLREIFTVPPHEEQPEAPPLIDFTSRVPAAAPAPEPENFSRAQTIMAGPVLDMQQVTGLLQRLESSVRSQERLEISIQQISNGLLEHQRQLLVRLESTLTTLEEQLRRVQTRPAPQNVRSSQPTTNSPTSSDTQPASTRSQRRRANGRRRSAHSTSVDQPASDSSNSTPQSRMPLDGTELAAQIMRTAVSLLQQSQSGLPPSYTESQMQTVASVPAGAERASTVPQT